MMIGTMQRMLCAATLAARLCALPMFTDRDVVGGSTLQGKCVFAIDMNGDGNLDVLAALQGPDQINWYENDGSEGFTEHTIWTSNTPTAVFAVDLDGDGT